MLRNIGIIFVMLLMSVMNAYSQRIEATISPQEGLIGDHFELSIKAYVVNRQTVKPPQLVDSQLGNFVLIQPLKFDTLYSGQDMVIDYKYRLTNFEDSTQVLPPIGLATSSGDTVYTPSLSVLISSPKLDSIKDIKPIKPIFQVPLSREELASYLFVSLILLALMVVLYFVYIRWIRKEALFDSGQREEPPHVIALKQLKETEEAQLWQRGYIKEYYDQISDTIRNYIEKRFGIKALEQTTPQILDALERLDLPSQVIDPLSTMLQLADLAKFARETPPEDNNREVLTQAYLMVQNTQSIYDSNKSIDATSVRKFYGQNEYRYRTQHIHQSVFRILVYGSCIAFGLIALLIILAYAVPIESLLIFIADSPLLFFGMITVAGLMLSLIIAMVVRSRLLHFSILFDHDAFFVRSVDRREKWLFTELNTSEINDKGYLIVVDKLGRKISISKYLEYSDEVYERIRENIALAQNQVLKSNNQ